MTLTGLLIFAATYAVAVITPGPGIAAIVARALGNGTRSIVPFLLGFVVGDATLFLVAVFGLAAVAQTHAGLLMAVKYAGAAYLLYLAYKLWTAPAVAVDADAEAGPTEGWRLFLTSYALTIGNPKAIVFFMAILPAIVDLERLDLLGIAELTAVLVAVIFPITLMVALAAARARRLVRSTRAVRALNRGTGVIMAGAAAVVAGS